MTPIWIIKEKLEELLTLNEMEYEHSVEVSYAIVDLIKLLENMSQPTRYKERE